MLIGAISNMCTTDYLTSVFVYADIQVFRKSNHKIVPEMFCFELVTFQRTNAYNYVISCQYKVSALRLTATDRVNKY